MKVDPAIIALAAENVRAEIISDKGPTLKLDPAIVQKIKEKVPVFAGMSLECLLRTLAVAEYYPVTADEVVFTEGDIGDSFFVVVAGEVRVEKQRNGRAVELARLGSGECFGEMALVGRHVRSATVRALNAVSTMRFYRERVDANPESAHLIYRNIARILAGRLDESSEMLAELVGGRVDPVDVAISTSRG